MRNCILFYSIVNCCYYEEIELPPNSRKTVFVKRNIFTHCHIAIHLEVISEYSIAPAYIPKWLPFAYEVVTH